MDDLTSIIVISSVMIVTILGWIYNYASQVEEIKYKERIKEREQNFKTVCYNMKTMNEVNTTKLVEKILKELGCNYDVEDLDEGEKRITFKFQVGTFYIITYPESIYTELYYPFWYECAYDDIDTLSSIQKGVNVANRHTSSQMFYDIDKEDNKVWVHTKVCLFLIPEYKDNAGLLHSRLDSIFKTSRHFAYMFDKK